MTWHLSKEDSNFFSYLRGLSILVVVFGHVGGFWAFRPYSSFLHVVIPIFFFLSGAVTFFSFERQKSVSRYYLKRFLSLLVPYYLLCLLSLLVYCLVAGRFPAFDAGNLWAWLLIHPKAATMAFPVGQVWFLHALFIIFVASPLYFSLRIHRPLLLIGWMCFCGAVAGGQLFFNVRDLFMWWGNDFYMPVVHSPFFIWGIFYVSVPAVRKRSFLLLSMSLCLGLSFLLVYGLNLDIDYAYHIPQDLYYLAGSFLAILFCILVRHALVQVVRKMKGIESFLNFYHKHTFSVFLLHTFAIYLSEKLLGFATPERPTISYGLTKFAVVLCLTSLFAVPFTRLSTLTAGYLHKVAGKAVLRFER